MRTFLHLEIFLIKTQKMSSAIIDQDAVSVTRYREKNFELLEYVKANRHEEVFNDVTIEVDTSTIGANRLILSCFSSFFEKMFKSKMKERYEQNVKVVGVEGKIVGLLVDYFYTGQITIDSDTVMGILAGADYFQVEDVKNFCFEFLSNQISLNTWHIVLTAANLYRSDHLPQCVYQYLTDNFNEIASSTEFKSLKKEDLILLFANLNKKQIREITFYQAIVNWIKHNEDERKSEFYRLFQLVNLKRFSLQSLQNILFENLLQDNAKCVKLVMKSLSDLLQKTKEIKNESKIILMGGKSESKRVTEIFNSHGVKYETYPDLPCEVKKFCSLKLNDSIISVGGCPPISYNLVFNTVHQLKLNEANLKWEQIASMNKKRCNMDAAVFNDSLVVAGGWNGEFHEPSVEYYDDISGDWKMASNMNKERCAFGLVVCDDSLFAIGGGGDKKANYSSVERLSSLDGNWEYVAAMLLPRVGVAAVSLNGFIYALGGKSNDNNKSRQKTVEKYDPKSNKWSYVSEMNYVRSGARACVLCGRIYVVGGYDCGDNLVQVMECYDPSKDKWDVVECAKNECSSLFGAVVVI